MDGQRLPGSVHDRRSSRGIVIPAARIKQIRAACVDLAPRLTTPPRVPAASAEAAGGTADTAGKRRFRHPLDRYPGLAHTAAGWPRVACVATAEDGTWGLGLTLHGAPVAAVINDHFGPLLAGQPVTATEKAWDLMHRATAPTAPPAWPATR